MCVGPGARLVISLPRRLRGQSSRPGLRFGEEDARGRIRFAAAAKARQQCTVHPFEVLSHFADVAAEGAPVLIELASGDQVEGRIGLPQLDSRLVPFFVPAGVVLPTLSDRIVQLRYRAADTPFKLETFVEPRWEGLLWQVSLPNSLVTSRIRLARRHPLRGWHFYYRGDTFEGADHARVVDLSTTGLALEPRAQDHIPRVGRLLVGTLVGPQGDRVPLRLQVQRAVPVSGRGVLVGCSYAHIGFQNMVRLANLVRLLRRDGPRS